MRKERKINFRVRRETFDAEVPQPRQRWMKEWRERLEIDEFRIPLR